MTIDEALQYGTKALPASDAPALDAAYLLLHALNKQETSWLHAHGTALLSGAVAEHYEQLLRKRRRGIPLAYILGSQEFYGRRFLVTPDVLIPRPTTEDLVARALVHINQLHAEFKRPLVVADIGTGSGCIAVTLALETSPEVVARVFATDISAAALVVARTNARRYDVESRLTFLRGDLLQPLRTLSVDCIVSNPPYVPTAALAHALSALTPATRGLQFEPRQALDGGTDGQTFTRQLRAKKIPLLLEETGGRVRAYN